MAAVENGRVVAQLSPRAFWASRWALKLNPCPTWKTRPIPRGRPYRRKKGLTPLAGNSKHGAGPLAKRVGAFWASWRACQIGWFFDEAAVENGRFATQISPGAFWASRPPSGRGAATGGPDREAQCSVLGSARAETPGARPAARAPSGSRLGPGHPTRRKKATSA